MEDDMVDSKFNGNGETSDGEDTPEEELEEEDENLDDILRYFKQKSLS